MALTFRHFDDAERPVAVAPEVIVFYGYVGLSVRSMIVPVCWCLVAVGWLIVFAIWPPAIVFAAIGLYWRKRCLAFCSSSAVIVAVEWTPVW